MTFHSIDLGDLTPFRRALELWKYLTIFNRETVNNELENILQRPLTCATLYM